MDAPVCVLTIAGADSGGGAGVLADARAIRARGGHAVMAITAITAQNASRVSAVSPVPPRLVTAQLRAVAEEFPIRAVKIGLLPSAAHIHAIAAALRPLHARKIPIVLDPVLASTSGRRFLPKSALPTLRSDLFPLLTLLTPNWPEAAELTGRSIDSVADAEAAARALLSQGCAAVLIKGGHAGSPRLTDLLATRSGPLRKWTSARISTANTHGTGCVLSSALATELARGRDLPHAVARARAFLRTSLSAHRNTPWAGRGPAFP